MGMLEDWMAASARDKARRLQLEGKDSTVQEYLARDYERASAVEDAQRQEDRNTQATSELLTQHRRELAEHAEQQRRDAQSEREHERATERAERAERNEAATDVVDLLHEAQIELETAGSATSQATVGAHLVLAAANLYRVRCLWEDYSLKDPTARRELLAAEDQLIALASTYKLPDFLSAAALCHCLLQRARNIERPSPNFSDSGVTGGRTLTGPMWGETSKAQVEKTYERFLSEVSHYEMWLQELALKVSEAVQAGVVYSDGVGRMRFGPVMAILAEQVSGEPGLQADSDKPSPYLAVLYMAGDEAACNAEVSRVREAADIWRTRIGQERTRQLEIFKRLQHYAPAVAVAMKSFKLQFSDWDESDSGRDPLSRFAPSRFGSFAKWSAWVGLVMFVLGVVFSTKTDSHLPGLFFSLWLLSLLGVILGMIGRGIRGQLLIAEAHKLDATSGPIA
jgi:ribosomal protein S15P/S13E